MYKGDSLRKKKVERASQNKKTKMLKQEPKVKQERNKIGTCLLKRIDAFQQSKRRGNENYTDLKTKQWVYLQRTEKQGL